MFGMKSSLKYKCIGMFLIFFAVFLTTKKIETSKTTTSITTEVREVKQTKRPRTTPSPSQEIVVVEYSTTAFLKEGK